MGERTRKLLTLRARTDHDLLVLVNRELDRGSALVDAATTRNSPLFAQAEKAFATATAMLPRIAGLSADDRQRIEAKVEQLRSRLDEVPAYANVRSVPGVGRFVANRQLGQTPHRNEPAHLRIIATADQANSRRRSPFVLSKSGGSFAYFAASQN